MKAEDGDFDGDSIGGGFDPLDEDRDDEDDLLDTTLTPEQVVKLEEQRADRRLDLQHHRQRSQRWFFDPGLFLGQ